MNKTLLKNLANLKTQELQKIIINLHHTNRELAQLVAQEIANHNPKELYKLIKKNIHSIKRSKRFLHQSETQELNQKLEQINTGIEKLLNTDAPQSALELCQQLISIDNSIFERVDDSFGYISGNYHYTYKLLNRAFIDAKTEPNAIADYLFETTIDDEYGVRGYILDYCKTALKNGADDSLEKRVYETKIISDFNRKHMLFTIADVRENVDAYIQIIKEECKKEVREIGIHEITEIAERLNKDFRGAESIEWLNTIPKNESFQIRERQKLFVEALQLEGETEQARDYLWKMFKSDLCVDTYLQCLKFLPKEQQATTQQNAIKEAKSHSYLTCAIHFLFEIDELDELDKLIQKRHDELDALNYSILRKASTNLANAGKALSATLLRRVLVLSVLSKGVSKYYRYAVSDLKKATEFAHNVNDWHEHLDDTEFISLLEEQHGRKMSFWSQWRELSTNP